jgi:hypothetical protein
MPGDVSWTLVFLLVVLLLVLLFAVLLQLLLDISEIFSRLLSLGEISGSPRPRLQSSRAFGLEIDIYLCVATCMSLLVYCYLYVATCVFHLCVAT